MVLRKVAAVLFLVAGVLELLFLSLSLLGTAMGGIMTLGTLAGQFRGEDAVIGPVIFVFYGLWLAATLIAGPTHIGAGVMLLTGRTDKRILWAGTAVSILPLVTVYCAPTSIAAGVVGLVAALLPDPDAPKADDDGPDGVC